ncbi:MAG: branched-chain amino acid ABC transporter permease, partial [Chloroflexi bacterium]
MDTFLGALVEGILHGGIYALLALGLVVIYKSSHVFNIAHGEIMMFLAYFMVFLVSSQDLPIGLSFLLVIAVGAGVGLACERIFLRPLIGKPMLITFMVALVMGILIRSIAILWHGGAPQTIALFPSGYIRVGDLSFSSTLVWSFVIALAMFLLFMLVFRYSKVGLGMRCVAEDHQTSQSLGIDVKKVFALSWAIGGSMAAIGGVLLGSLT